MIKKQNRLVSTYEFNKVRRLGRSYNAKHFHIFYLKPHGYTGTSKVGIVVSNKFDKSAVRRNKLKRIFREVLRKNFDKIKDDFWIVIHPKFHAINMPYEEINTDFVKTLQEISISR